MIMNIILWLVFGALAGWIASLIMRTDAEQGTVGNIVVGIIGAFLGGAISRWLGGPAVDDFSLMSLLVAVGGAVILLFFVRMLAGDRNTGYPR